MKERYYAHYGNVYDQQDRDRIIFKGRRIEENRNEYCDFREAVQLAESLNKVENSK